MPDKNSSNGGSSERDALVRWLQRHRLPTVAVGACAAVVAVDQWSVAWAFLWLAIIICHFFSSRIFALFAITMTIACAAFHAISTQRYQQELKRIGGGARVEFTAQIIESPKFTDRSWRSEAKVLEKNSAPAQRQKIFLSGLREAPVLGEKVRMIGYWSPVPFPRNEGEFHRAHHAKRNGIVAECRVIEWESIAPVHPFWCMTSQVRHGFENAITQGLDANGDAAKVIRAMVMGQQPSYQDDVVEPFRQTGTLHLFSVSGQHVNLVAMILWAALKLFFVPRRTAIFLLIAAVFGYAWLTGASPPAVRAAWMASIFLSAFLLQRKADLMQALAVVILAALLIDSQMLFLPGVQLSYGIVAVISIGLSLARKPLESMAWNDPYLPRELQTSWQTRCGDTWQKLMQSLVISTAACVGSAPLTIRYFTMITPISIVTNLILTPLVAALLAIALLSASLSLISPTLSLMCNRANGFLAMACINCSRFFSKVPGGHMALSSQEPRKDTIRIYDLPRGGGAVLLQCKEADALLDCGNERAFRSIVHPSLRYFGAKPDTLFLSHPEAAHIGGGALAMSQLPIRQIIAPVARASTPSFRLLQRTADEQNIPLYCGKQGARLTLSKGVSWENLHQPAPFDYREITDNRCGIHMIHFHGFRLLFLHDAGAPAVEQLIQQYPDLRCDVVIMGRHNMQPSSPGDWISLFQPRAIIATHSAFPSNESIPVRWIKSADAAGISFFHQGNTGMVSIAVQSDGNLVIAGFLNRQQLIITKP